MSTLITKEIMTSPTTPSPIKATPLDDELVYPVGSPMYGLFQGEVDEFWISNHGGVIELCGKFSASDLKRICARLGLEIA